MKAKKIMTGSPLQKGKLHVPVLLDEVITLLAPRKGGLYVDGTFGTGGYSQAVLESASCRVIGIDRDPKAVASSSKVYQSGRLMLIEGCFGNLSSLLRAHNIHRVDGITLDLGISAQQVMAPERGFSFKVNGPLDMRMGVSSLTASNIINTCTEDELARILRQLGEERLARKIAHAITCARPITNTSYLSDIIHHIIPHGRIDQATRTFQAIRVFINDELDELRHVLLASEKVLAPGGRLIVVTFHSLEDRIVKRFLHFRSASVLSMQVSRYQPTRIHQYIPTFRILTPRALRPRSSEVTENPYVRSARLRAAERISL